VQIKNKKTGFTLIELLVVISIIGLLSTVVLANVASAKKKAQAAANAQGIRQYWLALNQYFSDTGTYPGPLGVWSCLGPASATCLYTSGVKTVLPAVSTALQPYISNPYIDTDTITFPPAFGSMQFKGVVYHCSLMDSSGTKCIIAALEWPQYGTSCVYGAQWFNDGTNSVCNMYLYADQ
jgi:prepilin-type N-terminal cleavage/methylation domain-containing protein